MSRVILLFFMLPYVVVSDSIANIRIMNTY